MHLGEIILTFQTACVTNLDLTFGVGFDNLPNEKFFFFKKSQRMLYKNIQKNVDVGRNLSALLGLNKLPHMTVQQIQNNSRNKKNSIFTTLGGNEFIDSES